MGTSFTDKLRQQKTIITKCVTHGVMPNLVVCAQCVNQQNELFKSMAIAMQRAPKVIEELFDEGNRYKEALFELAEVCTSNGCEFVVQDCDGFSDAPETLPVAHHSKFCPAGIATAALKGYEERVLNRKKPADVAMTEVALGETDYPPDELDAP